MDHPKRQRLFWLQWVPGHLKPCAILCNHAAIVQNLQKSLPSMGTSDPCSKFQSRFCPSSAGETGGAGGTGGTGGTCMEVAMVELVSQPGKAVTREELLVIVTKTFSAQSAS
jgi:hypothetical protein